MREPYWHKVLDHFLKRRYVHNGLTIPFLIGSQLVLDSNRKRFTIAEVIDQMQDKNLKSPISVMRCSYIGDYVFGILDQESIKLDLEHSIYKSYNNLSITDGSFSSCDDLESIIKGLVSNYGKNVANEEFSKQNGGWTKFSEEDRIRILEVLEFKS